MLPGWEISLPGWRKFIAGMEEFVAGMGEFVAISISDAVELVGVDRFFWRTPNAHLARALK